MDPNLLNQLLQILSQNQSSFGNLFGQPQMSQDMGPVIPENNIIGRLKSGRPIVRNPDGSVSTHRNMVASLGGKSYIIPTIYGGQQVSPDEAIDIIQRNNLTDPDTGQPLQAYKSDKEALKAEQSLHKLLEQEIAPFVRSQR